MNEKLERYLDGEIGAEALGPDERAEAEAWGRLFAALRGAARAEAPEGLVRDVMASVGEDTAARGAASPDAESAPRGGSAPGRSGRGGLGRVVGWLVRPIRVPVPPAAALAAAALLALVLWPSPRGPTAPASSGPVRPASLTTPATSSPRVYVELSLPAKGATSVAVAGDFTGWRPTIQLQDPDGDGVWTALVPVTPGVHQYMFVVDGSRWVTDPDASRYVDDGFGHRNAVLAIAPPAGA
ncbi:MAG TPA: glycogen-binding domain-containing protein [Gemmatimonadota bacterium]|nr:glycogen-binding domain-containing protein [Gemmatimonadota bacterium]